MAERTDGNPAIDWKRIYPHVRHRWNMGLRSGDLRTYFARRESTEAALAERARWLAEAPEAYSALTPEALPALADTAALARSLGAAVDPTAPAGEQLLALGRAWEADFVWMHPAADGFHRLTGGVVCFPSMWALRDKLGKTMGEIHAPVPDLNDALSRPIETFLSRQQPGEVWLRENLNFARGGELNRHPARPHRPIDATVRAAEVWLRFEHQMLLRLAPSGSVLFAIRIEMVALDRALRDPAAAASLERAFTTMSPTAAAYKGLAAGLDFLIALCRIAAGNG